MVKFTINCTFFLQITKPLLERKRRARINRCLDELKDLMFSALEVWNIILNYNDENNGSINFLIYI